MDSKDLKVEKDKLDKKLSDLLTEFQTKTNLRFSSISAMRGVANFENKIDNVVCWTNFKI